MSRSVLNNSRAASSVLEKNSFKYIPIKLTILAEDFRGLYQSLDKDCDIVTNQANLALFHTLVNNLVTRRSKYSNIGILFYLTNILPHSLEPLQRVCVYKTLSGCGLHNKRTVRK